MLKHMFFVGASALVLANIACADETDPCSVDKDCGGEGSLRLSQVDVAGFTPVLAEDLTGSVSVLTADDISVRLSPNVADQLRAVPGIGVSGSGGDGALTQVRIRGAEANHTLVLFDGVEVSDPVNGETDFGLLTSLPVSRIEVLRGEASSIYGSDAIGGVVSLEPGGQDVANMFAEYGSQETFRTSAAISGGGISAALNTYETAGVDSTGRGGEDDGASVLSGLVRGGVVLPQGWRLSGVALARTSRVETDVDSDFDGLLDNADRETEADQRLIGTSLSGAALGLDHVFRASYNRVDRENFADGSESDASTGERMKLGWSPTKVWGVHQLSGLMDFEQETYRRTDVQYGGLTNIAESFDTFGFAGEYRFAVDDLALIASARHDLNDNRFDDATTWRVGGSYHFTSLNGKARTSIGTGVKNPTFTELFGFFPGSFIGNPDLAPEKSTSWEIGWDQTLGDLTLSATWFQAELEDEIYTAFTPSFESTAENRVGDSERSGVEFGARWQVTDGLTVTGQWTQTSSENDSGEEEIRVPESTAALAVSYAPPEEAYRLGLALDYVGDQDDFDFGAFPSRRVTLDAYTLLSASAELPITRHVSFTLRGENLLDEDATDVYGYNTPGAGVFIGLRLR